MACLITGCALTNGSSYVWGDLHDMGSVYIFNACLDAGEAAWQDITADLSPKHLDITNAEYFERRGVFVISKSTANLSKAAWDYIHKSWKAPSERPL